MVPDDPAQADDLLELVLAGRKTATASALRDYEQEARERSRAEGPPYGGRPEPGDVLVDTDLDLALPQPGLLAILLDGAGRPRARERPVPLGRLGRRQGVLGRSAGGRVNPVGHRRIVMAEPARRAVGAGLCAARAQPRSRRVAKRRGGANSSVAPHHDGAPRTAPRQPGDRGR